MVLNRKFRSGYKLNSFICESAHSLKKKKEKQPSESAECKERYPPNKMKAYTVADLVKGERVNDAKIIEPIGEKPQDETVPITRIRSHYPHKSKPSSGQLWFRSTGKE